MANYITVFKEENTISPRSFDGSYSIKFFLILSNKIDRCFQIYPLEYIRYKIITAGVFMTPDRLKLLASKGYNRVPLIRNVMADFETPLSTYLKLANEPYSYLFESVEGGEKWGRYSIIGLGSKTVIKVYSHRVIYEVDGKQISEESVDCPLKYIATFHRRYKVANQENNARFNGGLVGYFGYDAVRFVEKKLRHSTPENTLDVPDILLMLSENFVIFDDFSKKVQFVSLVDPGVKNIIQQTEATFDQWLDKLRKTSSAELENHLNHAVCSEPVKPISSIGKINYEKKVEKIKDYTCSGDVMQVVLSHRLSTSFKGEPINVYRSLRTLNPSPYMYFLNVKDFYIVGSSPEILVRLENKEVTLRPLAGTRKRGQDEKEDMMLEKELLSDPKEIAEHLMLIDLGRNDVGKVCETGSVKVTQQMVVERYSHVMHISSNVTGKIKPELSAMDVLSSALPAGTLSGSPKVRAMEIIDELEPVKRGVYGGAVGYLGFNGNMDMAIALRTAVIKDGMLHNQVGAGVVNDSVSEAEWEETINKSKAIFSALEIAQKGF